MRQPCEVVRVRPNDPLSVYTLIFYGQSVIYGQGITVSTDILRRIRVQLPVEEQTIQSQSMSILTTEVKFKILKLFLLNIRQLY